MKKVEKIEENIKILEEKIGNVLNLNEFEICQNNSEWKKVKQPINFSVNDGPTYLKTEFMVPKEIEGIRINNCKIYLKFLFPSGVRCFLNGTEIYSHKFWADKILIPILLSEKCLPGKKFQLKFVIPKGDGVNYFWAKISIDTVEEKIFDLKSLLYQLKFAQFLSGELKNEKLKKILNECIDIVDLESIEKRRWTEIKNLIENIEEKLEIFRKYAKEFIVHLIGHAHIDMNWLWTYDDTIDTVLRDFTTVCRLMEKYKELKFSQSQIHVYEIVEKNDKRLFEKVKKMVSEGRWEITANAYVENDLNMSDGESIARHIIYSKKYVKEKFGKKVEIMWSPDTFGHPQIIPTILNASDIKYYYFMRCGKGHTLFLWEGLDRSKVISFTSIYNNHIDSDRIVPLLIEYYKKYKISDFMFVYGVGDHGGGPTEEDIKRKIKLSEKPCIPDLKFSTTYEYFKKVEKYKNKLPIVKDELNFFAEGCYSTHSDIKKGNRGCENLLLGIESISTIAFLNKIEYQEKKIEDMWKKTLFNQFHDILCGSAIHASYDYSNKLIIEVKEDGEKIIKEITEKIIKKNEKSITVFNPVGWKRKELIKIPFSKGEDLHICDEKGNRIPIEIRDGKIIFVSDLPPYNFKNFYIKKGKINLDGFIKNKEELENNFYIIWIDKNKGLIRRLFDKKNNKEVIVPCYSVLEDPSSFWAESCANLIKIYWEEPHPMSAWIIGNIYKVENLISMERMEVKEGKLETVFEVERKYNITKIIQRIIIYKDFPYIDFEFETDWNIKGNKEIGVPLLRANFSFNFENSEFYCEVPFGVVKRKNIPREYPSLRWAGFKEDNYWYVIMNKEKYGYYVNGKELSLTLLRNSYEPDANPDSGYHLFSYRLFFGKSTIREIERMAIEYNLNPFFLIGETKKYDFFEIKGNLIPTGIKKSIWDNSVVLRLVEYEGKSGKCEIDLKKNIKQVWLSNINEEKVKKIKTENKKIVLNYKPNQIITIIIEF